MLLQIGVAAWLDNAWLFVTVVPAFLVLHFGIVLREERYLERRFGEPYRRYRRSVRRWL